MIYVKKKNIEEKIFIKLLEKTKKLLLNINWKSKNVTPTNFEIEVFEAMKKASKGTGFDGKIIQTSIHAFPDIVANKYFGVEVKMTTKDQWTSTGNSVLESSRVEEVERIYILFGKFGNGFDARYRLYQECLPDVSVTHSPRYRINMDLNKGETIFDKIGINYNTLRNNENPINAIKDYYRAQLKEGEELWWIDQEVGANPVIRPFRNLDEEDIKNYIVESMILFPEMFSNSSMKFERAAAYLIAEYNAVSASLRDVFTAGGQEQLKIKKKKVVVPKIFYNMRVRAKDIKRKINEMDEDKIKHYWRINKLSKNRLMTWKKRLNDASSESLPVLASDVFDSGL